MNNKGFTLIELLVVVAIIGILAAVGVVAYSGYTASAKLNAVKANQKMVINFIMSENKRCEIGETKVMGGNLNCSNRNTASILNAVQIYFDDKIKNPVNSSNPGICVSTNSCGNTYNYGSNNSEGVLNLHLINNTGTIRFGTCVSQPCSGPYPYNGNKVGYIETDPPINFLD